MATVEFEAPFNPIIYVRGYAGCADAIEETVADPSIGFDLCATKPRQTCEKKAPPHDLELPFAGLKQDHEYLDVCTDGAEVPAGREQIKAAGWASSMGNGPAGLDGRGGAMELEALTVVSDRP